MTVSTCRSTNCLKSCVLGKVLKSSWFFVSQVNWFQIWAGNSEDVVGCSPNLAHFLLLPCLQKSYSSWLCGLKLFAGSSNVLMYFIPSLLKWRWTFCPLGKSSVVSGRPELHAPAVSSTPESDAPSVELVGTSVHAWRRLQLDIWWMYCVIFRVDILVENLSRNQSWAMNWLLLRASRGS